MNLKPINPYQLTTPEETARNLAEKVRSLRLSLNWKQSTLASQAGVSLASLRRFERTGQISLKNLLRLVFAMGRLDDFESILGESEITSLKELEKLSVNSDRQRGKQ